MPKFSCVILMALLAFFPTHGICDPAPTPPFYEEIRKIIDPLEYTGVPIMVKPEVDLVIDFGKWTWTLRNIHQYDAQGRILLADGKYGLCAELATYVFERIKPMLNGRYEVKFARVTEAGFFSADESNHIVLLLWDKLTKQTYLIDPSFHQYAIMQELTQYHVVTVQDSLSFIQDKSHDVAFSVNQSTPLYIKNDFLLSFAVTTVDGKFDKNNFIFVISANRRSKFAGRDIVVIGRRNNEFLDFEDKAFLNELLSPQETQILFDKIKVWIERLHI